MFEFEQMPWQMCFLQLRQNGAMVEKIDLLLRRRNAFHRYGKISILDLQYLASIDGDVFPGAAQFLAVEAARPIHFLAGIVFQINHKINIAFVRQPGVYIRC
jgi:hypothetical protein